MIEMIVSGFLFLFILITNATSVAFGNEVGEDNSNAKLQTINDDPNKLVAAFKNVDKFYYNMNVDEFLFAISLNFNSISHENRKDILNFLITDGFSDKLDCCNELALDRKEVFTRFVPEFIRICFLKNNENIIKYLEIFIDKDIFYQDSKLKKIVGLLLTQ